MPTRLIAALCLGGAALCLLLSFGARSALFSQALIAEQLRQQATRAGVNLTVNDYRPAGFFGLRFQQVQLTARRGDYLIYADLEAVEVQPALKALFTEAALHPARIDLYGGQLLIKHHPAPASDRAPLAEKPAPERADTSAPPQETLAPPAILTVLHDVSISAAVAPLPAMARPLIVHRADFLVRPDAPGASKFKHAYGRMPDGTPFALKAPKPGRDPADKSARVYRVTPSQPTRLNRWFHAKLPVDISTQTLEFCPDCAPASLKLGGLSLHGPAGAQASARALTLLAEPHKIRATLPELAIHAPDNEQKDQLKFLYQLDNLDWSYDLAGHSAAVELDLIDAERGRANISASWSAERATLDTQAALQDFDTTALWPLLGIKRAIRGGVHTGKLRASYELGLDLVELSWRVESQNLELALPLVTSDPLEFKALGLNLNALLQPRARTFSVTQGSASFGQSDPVHFSGYALDARPGVVFDAALHADKLPPQALRDGLPDSLGKLARGTEFDGEFGFAITTAGHSAFPDGITLSVEFSGEVEVLGDSSYADVLSLAGDGPPSIDLPGTLVRTVDLNKWINYAELPPETPLVLAAAEDANFFSHDGFDWSGLRRAMAFNLREGALKRGGSTLSQQLSKNLFLDHQRTLARKLQEAYVTWRLEAELNKERIMELYINVAEWGPGVSGIRHAAQRYFEAPAEELSIAQTSLLAAILPGPSLFGSQVLNGYLPSSRLEKMEHILSNLRFMRVITPADYTQLYSRAQRGWVDDLKLTVCADDHTAPPNTPPCP